MLASFKANPPQVTGAFSRDYAKLLVFGGVMESEIDGATFALCTAKDEFFPQPGRFIDAVKVLRIGGSLSDTVEMRAERAWRLVREAASRVGAGATWFAEDLNGDGFALYAANQVGIDTICTIETEVDRAVKRKEFMSVYTMALSDGKSIQKVIGRHETMNRALNLPLGDDPALMGRSELPGKKVVLVPLPLPELPRRALSEGGESILRKVLGDRIRQDGDEQGEDGQQDKAA